MANEKPGKQPPKIAAAETARTNAGAKRRRRSVARLRSAIQRKVQSVRLTSHKARSRWFQTRAAWPVREAPVIDW